MSVVDVVVAAFGQPRLLRIALESIQRQTHRELEVLVSDDSRSEENRAVVAAFADARFRYVANRETLGPSGNHRRSLHEGQAPYVAILNQDDAWKPNFLATLLPKLASDDTCVVAFCDHEVWDEDGRLLVEASIEMSRRYRRDELAAGVHRPFHHLVATQAIPVACAAIFRRACVPEGEPPEDVGGAYDLWIAYRLASAGGGARYVPERLAAWRLHAASLGERRDAAGTLDIARTWERIGSESPAATLLGHARRQASSAFTQAALRLAASGQREEARSMALRGLANSISARGALRALLAAVAPAPLLRRLVRRNHPMAKS